MQDLPRGGIQAGRDDLPELATQKVLDSWEESPASDCETRILEALEDMGDVTVPKAVTFPLSVAFLVTNQSTTSLIALRWLCATCLCFLNAIMAQ